MQNSKKKNAPPKKKKKYKKEAQRYPLFNPSQFDLLDLSNFHWSRSSDP